MCLGIPGQIVSMETGHEDLAKVEVSGVVRTVNVALLDDLKVNDWVLIHVGFAMSLIDEELARESLELLGTLGEQYTEERDALLASRIEDA